jgi:hypothetical protein
MKLIFKIAACLLGLLPATSLAQSKSDSFGSVATTWPGIEYQIFDIERIAGNRVLIGIKLVANSDAPSVTSILVRTPVPKGADSSLTGTEPFSLSTAVATNELSKETYATVAPDPAGPGYLPGQMLGALRRFQGFTMSIQFEIPPAKPDESGATPKVSISLLLPNAKGPITKIVIPPPAPVVPGK